jgi:hypothetical protein
MAYDLDLANRIRECLGVVAGLSERQMFGGLAFLINGNMSVSVSRGGGLLLRIEPAQIEKLAARAYAGRFVMRGRETDGWLRIDPEGVRTKRDLARWVVLSVTYAQGLPPKKRTAT